MWKTTKQDLEMRVMHVRRLLKDLGTPIDLSINYNSGQPKLVFANESRHISYRKTKSEIDHVLYSIENVLYQIGYLKEVAEGN